MPRLGILVPSSNTALEPLVARMLSGLPDVTAHFSRFPVTRIDLSEGGLAQFDPTPIILAARLLADADVDVICWNGTSAGWCGFDTDRSLCAQIEAATSIPCVTSVLALNDALHTIGAKRFGLVSPYTTDVQSRIVANYASAGLHCVAERHLGISRNADFADVPPATLDAMCRETAATRPDALMIFCTNLKAADRVATLEAELGLPIYDTIATGIWKALASIGAKSERIIGWGSLFGLSTGS
ncbi:maleate cis-trans isomerase family protein [Lichenihabitans psoromatis]|uniref:maleate cis-trans isomerase family protein n=1 Tax=Lichenihabitans psoromatis TaxID=2528642 RepID=UPI001036B68D|nr:aspartate/glutamate racemase family protein [Lichenihabitans psoromatis]